MLTVVMTVLRFEVRPVGLVDLEGSRKRRRRMMGGCRGVGTAESGFKEVVIGGSINPLLISRSHARAVWEVGLQL